jgi:PAS domain S-box-containing protein
MAEHSSEQPHNAFEVGKLGTPARSLAEAAIERLREKGGVFVQAVRATRMPMAVTDPSLPGNPIVFANEAFLRLSGYDMEEVLGQQPFFMNGEETDAEDAVRFRQALAEDRDEVIETVQYRKDGSRFVASLFLSAFKDEEGRTLHQFLSYLDVTRRVDAEGELVSREVIAARLRESEEKYRTLFESIDQGFCVIEVLFDDAGRPADYVFLETNAAFERQTGLADAVGKRMRELAPNHERHWFDIYGQIALSGEPQRFELPAEALGRWYDVYAFRIGDPEQRRVAILFNDVAERKQAERELRESEEKYRTLFDTIDSGYALTDNVRDEEGRVVDLFGVDFNRSYTQHSGLPPFAGRRASEVITVQPEWLRQFEEVTRTGVPARHENYIAERDRWVSTHYSLVGDLGSDRVAVVFDDITDRKRAEAALRESEERQAFLLKLSDALRPISDPIAVQEAASRLTAEHLDIGRVAYCKVRHEPEPTAVIERDWPRRDLPSMAGRHRVADFGAFLGKEMPAGRPVVVSDARADPRLSDTERGHWASLGVVASYNVPIIKDGRVAAYLVAHDNRPHHWAEGEIAILDEVAERTWAAVERARAEAELRESKERQAFLLQLSDALRPLADAEEIQATTTRLLGAYLGVDRAMYAEVTGEPGAEAGVIRGQFIRPAGAGRPAPAPFPDQFSYETFGADVMARRYTGEGLAVADVNGDGRPDCPIIEGLGSFSVDLQRPDSTVESWTFAGCNGTRAL